MSEKQDIITGIIIAIIVGVIIFLIFSDVPLPAPSGSVAFPTSYLKVAPADYTYTCVHHDTKHRHFLAGETHIFRYKGQEWRGGRHYHYGKWITFDWGKEVVTDTQSVTYDCTGAHSG